MKENKTILRLKDKVSAELYTLLTTGRILHLTLTKEWYLKIACGDKKEEYREIKPYWLVRFIDWRGMDNLIKKEMCEDLKDPISAARWNFDNNYCNNRQYDLIVFKNGYGDAPTMIVKNEAVRIQEGKESWGAVAKQFYFTLKLGKVLYSEPCS